MATEYPHRIALLGLGTIGLSMLAMHLRRPDTSITVYDPRPDYESQIRSTLPSLLDSPGSTNLIDDLIRTSRLKLSTTVAEAIQNATIIQEQSPEVTSSKQALWKEVAGLADPDTHLWSSSSGIPASAQASGCSAADRVAERLLVAHPFNPPHLMPLVEIVPGPETEAERVDFVKRYFGDIPGPAVSGGDQSGLQHYRPITLQKLAPTIQDVWGDLGQIDIQGEQAWKQLVVKQTEDAYGPYTPETRKKKEEMLRDVVEMQKKKWGEL